MEAQPMIFALVRMLANCVPKITHTQLQGPRFSSFSSGPPMDWYGLEVYNTQWLCKEVAYTSKQKTNVSLPRTFWNHMKTFPFV